jgi:hypothetical protein
MTRKKLVVGWLVVLAFSMALACSSQERDDGGGGADGAASDARFACGDASCSVAREYCRDLTAGSGGAPGANDSGASGPVQILSCVPFGACAASDCSCVPQYGGYFCGACSQEDGGGTLAICGTI